MTLELMKNNPILYINGRKYFIDTGCPGSFSSISELEFDGKTYRLPDGFYRYTVEAIRKGISDELVGLIGMDILAEKPFILDYENLRFKVEPESDTPPMFEVDLVHIDTSRFPELLRRIAESRLRIDLMLKGEKIHAAVDTGAPISYMSSSFAKNLSLKDVREDYHPDMDCFEAKIYEVKWTIGNHKFEDEFGVLPDNNERFFQAEGLDCVIGYNLFKKFALEIDVKNRKIRMR